MKLSAPGFGAAFIAAVLSAILSPLFGEELYVRVIDVGAGECVVIKAPSSNGSHFMIFDAGNYEDRGRTAIDGIRDVIDDESSTVDLLVLSHSDSDHVAAVPTIMEDYKVKQTIYPGIVRDTKTWENAVDAIQREARSGGGKVWNLAKKKIQPGTIFQIGDATATIVAGFATPPADFDIKNESERMNAGSVVVRIAYGGKSVLICGDAVGRHIDDPVSSCIAEEKFMVDNVTNVLLDSDVIVAPHHGADNGSSTAFIAAVSPEYVIFSAGHKFDHPRKTAASRYLSAGVAKAKMFRTDLGDDESASTDKEWAEGRKAGTTDKPGDDDVEITISDAGHVEVSYRNQ